MNQPAYAGTHRATSPTDQHDAPTITAKHVQADVYPGVMFLAIHDDATHNTFVIKLNDDGMTVLKEALRLPVPTCATYDDTTGNDLVAPLTGGVNGLGDYLGVTS